MSMDIDEQYHCIYRYCYNKVQHRELAEDITQETFLRFFSSKHYQNRGKALPYLYTIARNLCVDEYRRRRKELLFEEEITILTDEDKENDLLNSISVATALEELDSEERELLLLRYVNEVPISTLSKIYQVSRFVIYRKLKKAISQLKTILRREDFE